MEDGWGTKARFDRIAALADGRGGLWVADKDSIRRLDTLSWRVTTLGGGAKAPKEEWWESLAFDPAAGTLWAASATVVCRVRTEGSVGLELAAGVWEEEGSVDSSGTAARFHDITALLPVAGGRLLIADGPDPRCMDDACGAVSTLLRGCFVKDGARQLVVLRDGGLGAVTAVHGSLLLISGKDFTRPWQPPTRLAPAAFTDHLLGVLAPPAEVYGGDGGSSVASGPTATATAAALCGAVTVRVGGRAFPAHRSVLTAGSEYFARLLAPGGGFAESGAPEVALLDADPAAFAHLLSYMYGTSLGLFSASSPSLAVPPALLRPTAALAGRLLMGGGAVAALTERLAAAATPASVLSDLAWADAHGMTGLAEQLRTYSIPNRKALDPSGLRQLVDSSPEQAAELLKAFTEDF
ncbi:hypothetical protein HYH03_008460 [Edaphochlamys debaryana]|uniref:BTB domain-containing protein n=1 Tax=Edaphochlamys debaryana TaxID=47281 RepID=A0A835Y6E9_9CHLO|nr:hypothetical protein HYH03_008460 [Edaphochlamys debaryana]|eukprot:KAG2493325.1 hypothetical protein HYH03_008460 [Edaphochlamys debaryana]